MAIIFECDRSMSESTDLKFETQSSTSTLLLLKVTSRKSCPMFSLTYLYEKYPLIFSIVFLIAGLFVAFAGIRMYKAVLFILATFLVGFLLLTIIYQMIMSKYVDQWVFWVCLGISSLVGLTAGGMVVAYNKYCFVIAGACLGGVAGFVLYTTIFARFVDAWMVYVIVAIGAIVCAIVNYFLKDPILIAASALTGSYLFISGIGFWAGGFPSITDLYTMIQNGSYDVSYHERLTNE